METWIGQLFTRVTNVTHTSVTLIDPECHNATVFYTGFYLRLSHLVVLLVLSL